MSGLGTLVTPLVLLLLSVLGYCFFKQSKRSINIALFSVLLIIYLLNGRTLPAGDTIAARYLPLSILREGNFDLDEFSFLFANDLHQKNCASDISPSPHHGLPYYLTCVNGHYLSAYPVGAAVLAVPFYLPIAVSHVRAENSIIVEVEKISVAAMVALSATILYAALRRLTTPGMALLVAVAYGLGSSSLSVSSQALWQHGPSQLCLAVSIYCLIRAQKEPHWVGYAGFSLAFAVVCRPTNILIVLPLTAYILLCYRPFIWHFLVGSLPPILFQLWYNETYLGNLFPSNYANASVQDSSNWKTPLGEGLLGILFSPARGLFVYSPIFLLSLIGIASAWRNRGAVFYRFLSIGVVLEVLLYSKWIQWWGGWTFGPRLLADITPLLAVLLCPLRQALTKSRLFKVVFAVLLLWSITAHAIGAFLDDATWHPLVDLNRSPHRLWSLSDNQLVYPVVKVWAQMKISFASPTSRSDPRQLAASYISNIPHIITAVRGMSLQFDIETINTGKAVWLAWGMRPNGLVRLGWRWMKNGKFISEDRAPPLQWALAPGERYRFDATIETPQQPGTYSLEIGLVSEGVTWFSDAGTQPIQASVKVLDVNGNK